MKTSVLILGYGREGQSVHEHLLAQDPHCEISVADQAEIRPLAPVARRHIGSTYLDAAPNYDVIYRSPGIRPDSPQLLDASRTGSLITSATNLFFEECPGRVIGVTGTKGKSTTSSLIAAILRQKLPDVRLVGNIGLPALRHLKGATAETQFVMELSSQQLVDAQHSPQVAVILNVVPEHLDFHDSFDRYLAAKANISRRQSTDDYVVYDPRKAASASIASQSPGRSWTYDADCASAAGGCCLSEDWIVAEPALPIMPIATIPLMGSANLTNVLAAASVGRLFAIEAPAMRSAIESFKPLLHRLEVVAEINGTLFINDSLATVPEATMAAIQAVDNRPTTLIAGGHDRGLEYEQLGRLIVNSQVATLILFPPSGERIWQAVSQACKDGSDRPISKYDVTTMEDAVTTALTTTPPGGACVLSPASASYGLFRDYQDRGDQFRQLVLASLQEPPLLL